MRRLPKLVKITPDGKIVAALIKGPKGYGELKSATGLSDRWLSRKLSELSSVGLIERRGRQYQVKTPMEIIDADPVFAQFMNEEASLGTKAKMIAEEIGRNEHVVAVVLFGSVAKGKATKNSDADMLVVTDMEIEGQMNETIYSLMFKYDVPVETIFLTFDDLLINLQAKTAFSLGLLEGYQTLYDRGGIESLLSIKKKEIQKSWVYDEEVETWIQKRLLPTLKPLKSS